MCRLQLIEVEDLVAIDDAQVNRLVDLVSQPEEVRPTPLAQVERASAPCPSCPSFLVRTYFPWASLSAYPAETSVASNRAVVPLSRSAERANSVNPKGAGDSARFSTRARPRNNVRAILDPHRARIIGHRQGRSNLVGLRHRRVSPLCPPRDD